MSFKYRREIDGLRALAIIPVVLFHAEFELFGGVFSQSFHLIFRKILHHFINL